VEGACVLGGGERAELGQGFSLVTLTFFFVLNYIIYFWFSLFVVFYQLNIT